MSKSSNQASNRRASSTRLTVLLLFLLVIGAGCIYEFAVARPEYQEAWEKIRKVDESPESSEYTSDQIQEMVGQEPFRTEDGLHENCVVHTYRWRSGLLVKNHDIHVVYTKLNPTLLEKNPELKGKLYYYSASAGQPLDLDANFPQEKPTIVENLNPPMMSIGGGGGGGAQQRRQRQNRGQRGNDDDKGKEAENKDEAGGDEAGEEKSDSGDESAEATTEEKTSEAGDAAAEKPAEDNKTDADKTESTEDKKSGEEKKTDEDKSDG